jgi:hypothetical protein
METLLWRTLWRVGAQKVFRAKPNNLSFTLVSRDGTAPQWDALALNSERCERRVPAEATVFRIRNRRLSFSYVLSI